MWPLLSSPQSLRSGRVFKAPQCSVDKWGNDTFLTRWPFLNLVAPSATMDRNCQQVWQNYVNCLMCLKSKMDQRIFFLLTWILMSTANRFSDMSYHQLLWITLQSIKLLNFSKSGAQRKAFEFSCTSVFVQVQVLKSCSEKITSRLWFCS